MLTILQSSSCWFHSLFIAFGGLRSYLWIWQNPVSYKDAWNKKLCIITFGTETRGVVGVHCPQVVLKIQTYCMLEFVVILMYGGLFVVVLRYVCLVLGVCGYEAYDCRFVLDRACGTYAWILDVGLEFCGVYYPSFI